MKIGLVLDDSLDKYDGVQQYVLGLGGWLSDRGHEVHYLVGETKRTDLTNMHSLSKNIRIKFNKNVMSTPLPANKARLKSLLSREDYDVIHIQMPYSPFLAGRIINLAPPSTAIVGTFHILPFARSEQLASQALGIINSQTLKKFDELISVSDPAADFALQKYKFKSRVIPNFVHTGKYMNAKPLPEYRDGKFNIMFLGRLVERKGCLQLLMAIKKLSEIRDMTNVRVIICGDGPLKQKLHRYVRENKLQSSVIFTGYLNEEAKPRFLASADLCVFPSLSGESFGIVLVEAMATGKCVVLGGDNPGYSYVLDNNPKHIFNPNDSDYLAAMIDDYISNKNGFNRELVWQSARLEEFDLAKVGAKVQQIYVSAIAKNQK